MRPNQSHCSEQEMEYNADTRKVLSSAFRQKLSSSERPPRSARPPRSQAVELPNYGVVVLRMIADPSVDERIRYVAAVNFKDHLQLRWVPAWDSTLLPIGDEEKSQIKTLILSVMRSSSARVRSELSEALSIIVKHDFPRQWPALLPELVNSLQQVLQSADYVSINGILDTANYIFMKIRYEYKTYDSLSDLKYCLDNFATPVLEIFRKTAGIIDYLVSCGGSAVTLRPLFESQRLCCRIFYSLNFQVLPEFFGDHMKEWMDKFRKYLTTNYPALESRGDGLALVDGVRAAVCENISLYMEKNEEEFKGYLNDFASALWTLLGNVSQSSSRDKLAVMAIKFLTTVRTSMHHVLFAGEGVVPWICESVVIPNVLLSEDDQDLFKMNDVEFIRRDIKGSNVDARRRTACELLKVITTNYREQVMKTVYEQVQMLLSLFAANPIANWKAKDCAIYLVVSLSTLTEIVYLQGFFTSVIVTELRSQDVNGFPMLKAGALKFFTMFRSHIPKPFALELVSDVVRFLGAESYVVHSYAANCIERLLLVKDEGGRSRYTSPDIAPILPVLIENLFNALNFPKSEENQYVMKCIMRVLGAADISGEVAIFCMKGLTSFLNVVSRSNPIVYHYLFESVAMLIKRACERDISLISSFEENLFPSIQSIFEDGVIEFLPYIFQLVAQLVELNRQPLSPAYVQSFITLLSPDSWKRTSDVPALVRLLQAFLQKGPHEFTQEGRLSRVLGIFEMLVSSSSTEDQGFYLLNTVIENLEYGGIAPYVRCIWSTLFSRLENHQTMKFIKSLLIFMSLFIVKHGSENFTETVNAVRSNIFLVILEQFWIPNLKLITGTIDLKLAVVSSAKLICESPVLLDAFGTRHWGKMLDSIITLLSMPEEDRVDDEPEMPDIEDNIGYTATFVRLYNVGKKEEDPLKDIRDPKEFLVASLARLSAISPGRYPQIISENLEPANQAALIELCRAYSCPIV